MTISAYVLEILINSPPSILSYIPDPLPHSGSWVFYFHHLGEGMTEQNIEPILIGLCFKNPDIKGGGS